MALAKLSGEIIHIRGRFGGVYFKKSPDGQHVQAMPRVRNYARSPAQQGGWGEGSPFMSMGIAGFSGAAGIWMLACLAFFSAAWAAYALVFWFTTKTGERKKITGYNWFIHYALRFPEAERPPFWKPPHAIGELPNFLVNYMGMWTYEHSPLEWPVECCSGMYYEGLPCNLKKSYRTDDLKWFLWWKDPVWVLSPDLGFETPNLSFYSPDANIQGYYYNPVTKKYAHVYFGSPEEKDLPH
ncbi:hypothetical protein ES707_13404 [subsurface metagenome]